MKIKSVLLGLAALLMFGCHTVEAGNVGVETCWGKVTETTYSEGGPYGTVFCEITDLSTRTQSYTMAGAGNEAQVNGSVQVLTNDQLTVLLDVTVQFHLNPSQAIPVFRALGKTYDDTIVHPLVRTAVRDAASEFRALQLVDERAVLQTRMERLIRERLANTLHGRQISASAIIVDNILLRNIDLPNSLDESIASVQRQRQETERRVQETRSAQQQAATETAAAEGRLAVAQVNARADSEALLTRTRADAEALRVRTEAQASANRVLAATITPEILRLRQIELGAALLSSPQTRTVMLPAGQTPTLMLPTVSQ